MSSEKPSIFEYTDYREYLRDLYNHLKENTEYFSYRYFSKKAGFRSPNYLKLVIEGQRNISEDSVEKFCQAFKWNKKECQFFDLLVNFTQAPNARSKSQAALKIVKSKIYQQQNPLSQEQLHYCQRWYQIGVRELSLCQPLPQDPNWLAQQFIPKISAKEAKEAVDSLVALSMLKEDEDGNLVPTTQNLWSQNEVVSSFVSLYHKEMMTRAQESIDLIEKSYREISSVCVPVSEETFEKMKTKIQEFRKELMAMADQDPNPNQIYQVNFQLFPLTKKVEQP